MNIVNCGVRGGINRANVDDQRSQPLDVAVVERSWTGPTPPDRQVRSLDNGKTDVCMNESRGTQSHKTRERGLARRAH